MNFDGSGKPESFQCEWLKGRFEEAQRPDKCGVIFVRNILGRRNLVACEVAPGAICEVQTLLDSLAKKEVVVLKTKAALGFIGPVEDVEKTKRIFNRDRHQ